MLNFVNQKNVTYTVGGVGIACVAGGLWYYRSSVWSVATSWWPWSAASCNKQCKSSKNETSRGSNTTEPPVKQCYSEKTE